MLKLVVKSLSSIPSKCIVDIAFKVVFSMLGSLKVSNAAKLWLLPLISSHYETLLLVTLTPLSLDNQSARLLVKRKILKSLTLDQLPGLPADIHLTLQ